MKLYLVVGTYSNGMETWYSFHGVYGDSGLALERILELIEETGEKFIRIIGNGDKDHFISDEYLGCSEYYIQETEMNKAEEIF